MLQVPRIKKNKKIESYESGSDSELEDEDDSTNESENENDQVNHHSKRDLQKSKIKRTNPNETSNVGEKRKLEK